jgi:hypothetical protein
LSGACRRASKAVANMMLVSRTADAIFPIVCNEAAGSWEYCRCLHPTTRSAQPACDLTAAQGLHCVGRLVGHDACPVTRFSQCLPPRPPLARERVKPAPPFSPSRRKTQGEVKPCGAYAWSPRSCSNAEIFRFIEQSDSNPYSQITDRGLSKTRETQP